MRKNLEYINKNNIRFSIHIETTPVQQEANFWGFYFKVTELGAENTKVFKAMVSKRRCLDQELAEVFIETDPLTFLKSDYLDNYEDGETPLVWPDLSPGWIVI